MYGTHAANRLVEDRAPCAVGPAVSLLPKRRRWESNPLELLCRQPPCRLAPASSCQCPRQESNLVFDLRRVACKSATLRGRVLVQRPAEESNLVLQFRRLPCYPAHSQGVKCLDQESNLDLDLRRVLCDPLHHRDIQHPDLESNQDQGLRRALCDPLHHRDIHIRADDWICTSIDAVYKTAASLFGHVGKAGARGFEPRPAALETACSPRSTLLYRPPALRPGALA